MELFLATGEWVTKEIKEVARQNCFRLIPTRILVNPSSVKRLFSDQEFKELLYKAISSELESIELDAIGTIDNYLELLLVNTVDWQEEMEAVHLEILQEKLNNYIYFLESKQYIGRYGDNFAKKSSTSHFSIPHLITAWLFLQLLRKSCNPQIKRLFVNCSGLLKSYNLERTKLVLSFLMFKARRILVLKLSKFRKPKALRLMTLMRLLVASIFAFE
ncbi:hypothetical protein D8797_02240 [Streptococcus cristatus]|nr:hypothetical protein D8797_02240 [Streptococcus cristatus]